METTSGLGRIKVIKNLLLAGMFLGCFIGCARKQPAAVTLAYKNPLCFFPCLDYEQIEACKLGADEVKENCRILSPAHRADLWVGLALTDDVKPRDWGMDCFNPTHEFRFVKADTVVARLTLDFHCQSVAFYPYRHQIIATAGFERMEMVFDEMGMLENR